MTKAEFQRAFDLAKQRTDLPQPDWSIVDGCGLPEFTPVTITIETMASLIRWQAHNLDGTWDEHALTELKDIARHKFTMVG